MSPKTENRVRNIWGVFLIVTICFAAWLGWTNAEGNFFKKFFSSGFLAFVAVMIMVMIEQTVIFPPPPGHS